MARTPRQYSPTGVYHVMLRGINRMNIFNDEIDCMKFMKILRTVVEPTNKKGEQLPPCCKIHAFCLMTNHIHLLVSEGEERISKVMKRINVAYVSYYNLRHDRLGPLFHDRFRSEVVGDAKYYITLLRYIHQNPVEAAIVDRPGQYRWSSWHEYMSAEPMLDGICELQAPFPGISREQLREMVMKLDEIPTATPFARKRMTNEAALEILKRITPLPEAVRDLPLKIRHSVIIQAVEAGISMRKLSYLIGIDYKTISNIIKRNR